MEETWPRFGEFRLIIGESDVNVVWKGRFSGGQVRSFGNDFWALDILMIYDLCWV